MDVEKYYDERAPFYDGEYKTPFFKLYNAITWDNIQRYLPEPEESLILDVGGGTGQWTIPLAEKGHNMVLADISRGMLRQARLKLEEKNIKNVTLQREDIADMSFEDDTFDMVLAQGDPLSYCENAANAVEELYRVLKPGCYCSASVDSLYHMLLRIIVLKRWDALEPILTKGCAAFKEGFTIHYFTPQSLCKSFENAGFEVVRIIGKPVFLSATAREKANSLLEDEKTFQKVLELELQYCDDVNLLGIAQHLEIVGKK